MEAKKIILQFICPDKAGVLSAATQFLFKRNAFMTEVSSFSDNDTKKFFSRIAFENEDGSSFNINDLEKEFSTELKEFNIDGRFFNAEQPCKACLLYTSDAADE